MKRERNYGIDLLRMLAMFMVTVLHVLGQGGVLGRVHPYSGQYLVSWFLEIAAMGSVNLYALISGYVGVKSKYRVTNLVVLWLQVFLYSFGIAALFRLVRPELCADVSLLDFAFPVLTKKYWYFTAYVCLFLFMPVLNAGINALSKRALRLVAIAMVLVFSVVASAARETSNDPFMLVGGYSGFWLMILYVVGAYIGKYGMWESVPKAGLFCIYFGSTALGLAIKCLVRILSPTGYNVKFVASFLSPLVVLGSIALLLLFSRLECGKRVKKGVAFLAPAAFGVYILHVHPLIWEHWMKDRFAFLAKLSPLALAGAVLLSALGIYLLCSLVDLLRIAVFKALEIRQGCTALEEKLLRGQEKEKIGNRE